MTTTDCTVIFAAIAAFSSFAAAVFAVLTFVRTVSWQAPTVDFLVNDRESRWASHRLIISNPTRSVLVLEYVKVLCPQPETVTIEPAHLDHKGTTDRAYEQLELGSKTTKPVFLSVPPGGTEKLELGFGLRDDFDFEVDFRLCWSKGSIRWPERWFIPTKVKLDAAQVKNRTIAVVSTQQRGSD